MIDKQMHWDTLGEMISYQLRIRIVFGECEAGTKLSENQIATEFGTSRSPVREAFKILEHEGLIRLERMGAVVLGLDSHDLQELYEVRSLIESFALKRLAEKKDEHVITVLENYTDKMILALKYKDYKEFSNLDFSFHNSIINSIRHNRITHLWNSIKHIVSAVILVTTENRFTSDLKEMDLVIQKHRLLIEAIKREDPAVIDDIFEDHFDDSFQSINKLFP